MDEGAEYWMSEAQKILNTAKRYNLSQDMMKEIYGIDSTEKLDLMIISTSWLPDKILKESNCQIETLIRHAYFSSYRIDFEGKKIGWIQTAAGSGNVIDTMIACADSKTEKFLFLGSAGALVSELKLGDLLMPSVSLSYDGGSVYLKKEILHPSFGEAVKLEDESLKQLVKKEAERKKIQIHEKKVFCTDSIVCEYSLLDEIKATGAEVIEMETCAFQRCINLMEKQGVVLLCVSDNSASKISLTSKTSEQKAFFQNTLCHQIPELIRILFN